MKDAALHDLITEMRYAANSLEALPRMYPIVDQALDGPMDYAVMINSSDGDYVEVSDVIEIANKLRTLALDVYGHLMNEME